MDDSSDGDSSTADREPGPGDGPTATSIPDQVADDAGTFASVAGHFYRGEMDRATAWRTRLDQTTNWAVIVMAAILTWAFSSPDNPHYVLLIGVLAVGVFLTIEAQRYQEYDAWRSRLRVLQKGFFADVFRPGDSALADWQDRLSADLREPRIDLSLLAALGHRLQRIYLPLVSVLIAAWVARITVFEADESWYVTASVGTVPGTAVVTFVAGLYAALLGVTVWSITRATKREFDRETKTRLQR